MREKLIGVDIDGILCDLGAGIEKAGKIFGLPIDRTKTDFGLPSIHIKGIYDWMIRSGAFLDLGLCDWTHMVRVWHNQGHMIFYITRRRPGIDQSLIALHQQQTLQWLYRNDFPQCQRVVFTQHKALYCKMQGIDIMVEDYKKDALHITKNGTKTYLVDRLWNQGEYPFRIQNLSEVTLV